MFESKSDTQRSQPKNIISNIPVVHKVVVISVDLHHLLYSNHPEGNEKGKSHHIEPVVVSV